MSDFIKTTSIPGLLYMDHPIYADHRGFFREVFHLEELEKELGHRFKIVQWNHSQSLPGVIRGQHAEGWNKLIYPTTGQAFLSLADIRPNSPTFGKYEAFEFNGKDYFALYVPKGLANSICVTGKEPVNYLYLVDAYYDGSDTNAVAWDDPDINIKWPIKNPIISDRDKHNSHLRQMFPEKFK